MKKKCNYEIILELFVSKDEMRDWMCKPFIIDDKIHSTNGHILVAFDKRNIIDLSGIPIAPAKRTENIYPLESNLNKEISIRHLKDCFKKVKMVEDYDTIENQTECDECDGKGTVTFTYEDKKGKEHDYVEDCPICDGHGIHIHKNEKPNGKLFYDDKSICMIGNSHFKSTKIESIIKVAELLNADSFKITYQKKTNGASMFRVFDVDLLIMPIFFDELNEIDFKIETNEKWQIKK